MNGHYETNDHSPNPRSSSSSPSSQEEINSQDQKTARVGVRDDRHLNPDDVEDVPAAQRIIPILVASIKPLKVNDSTADVDGPGIGQNENLKLLKEKLVRLKSALAGAEEEAEKEKGIDIFRQVGGFESVLESLISFSRFFAPSLASTSPQVQQQRQEKVQAQQGSSISQSEENIFTGLVLISLQVIGEAIRQHHGNRWYFSKKLEIDGACTGDRGRFRMNGWDCLRRVLIDTGIAKVSAETAAQLLDELLSLALDRDCAGTFKDVHLNNGDVHGNHEQFKKVQQHVSHFFGEGELIKNTEAVRLLFSFWSHVCSNRENQFIQSVSIMMLIAFTRLASFSLHNVVALHKAGIMSELLLQIWDDDSLAASPVLLELIEKILQLGFPSLKDAHYFIRKAYSVPSLCNIILKTLLLSKGPSVIQFDCSLHGYSSLELPSLGKQFPPLSSAGLTLSTWLRIDQFDSKCHTTVFGAFDPTQTCFALAYIEKGSHQFVWQTSIVSSKPSIKFKSVTFEEGCWYDITLVHRRPKPLSSSRAALFVDGEFVEQQKCLYPTAVDSRNVQVFVGTPRDLAVHRERNAVSSCWSLASLHLWSDVLSDEFIMVRHKLGPTYTGNYQDALGPFQTYQASAELYLRNEMLHPGKEENSHIVSAIKNKAGHLYPEGTILLSISPHNVIAGSADNEANGPKLIENLSKGAIRKLQQHTRFKGNAMVINGANSSINTALLREHGAALLMGEPVVALTNLLHDHLRCAGGFVAVGLSFLRVAKTKHDVLQAVEIIFQSVHSHWRNSEAMESENGFGTLAGLLSCKVGLSSEPSHATTDLCEVIDGSIDDREALAEELLKMILSFTGYQNNLPAESMLINPLAYRTVIVDAEFWRMTRISTQKLYYSQFSSFIRSNKFQRFNCKRIARMRIVKKFLEAMKADKITRESLNERLKAFETVLDCGRSADILRSIALFITYVLKDPRSHSARSGRSSSVNSREQSRSGTSLSDIGNLPQKKATKDNDLTASISSKEVGVGLLELLSKILCEPSSSHDISRFAKTWLIYLLAESDGRIVTFALKILSRVLVINGSHYVKKFSDPNKNNGFLVLKMRLKYWHDVPAIWVICFALFFGIDIATINLNKRYTVRSLLTVFDSKKLTIANPEVFPVIAAMLGNGLRSAVKNNGQRLRSKPVEDRLLGEEMHFPLGTCFCDDDNQLDAKGVACESTTRIMIQFLATLQASSTTFRNFAATSSYVQDLLVTLFRVVVNSEHVKAETELNSREPLLTFQGQGVPLRPRSTTEISLPPIAQTVALEDSTSSATSERRAPLRRSSSFVLIPSAKTKALTSQAKLDHVMSPRRSARTEPGVKHDLIHQLTGVVTSVFTYQVLERKDFNGLGLFLKVPPGNQEEQAYFESFLFAHVMDALTHKVNQDQKILNETRVLSNMARYVAHMCEAVFEGWFIDGAESLLDFTGNLLDYLQRPAISDLKSVRLCSQQVASIRVVFLRTALLRLSELNESHNFAETEAFLGKVLYWQTIILSPDNLEVHLLRLLCYQLYVNLISSERKVRTAAATFWRLFLVQKPLEISAMLASAVTVEQKHLCDSFPGLSSLDDNELLTWIDSHRSDLDSILQSSMSKAWDDYVAEENRNTRETAKHRIMKRKERLRQWQAEEEREERQWRYHSESTEYWRNSVYASERLKFQRSIQDQQENLNSMKTVLNRFDKVLREPCHLIDEPRNPRWQLDETEGRNRMRLRVVPYEDSLRAEYLSKQKSNRIAAQRPRATSKLERVDSISLTTNTDVDHVSNKSSAQQLRFQSGEGADSPAILDDDFEIIENPREDNENLFEDKNRKVMRSLRHGDQVCHVHNVSRVVGLEAFEGLLILGKNALYLLDGFFQRSDGEIVRAWQAPEEEKDSYLQMISGQGSNEQKAYLTSPEQNNRNWDWNELISISRRRFLFRDVALEIFFDDGRSYLLNSVSSEARDNLYAKLAEHAPNLKRPVSSTNASDNSWRIESLRSPEDVPQTLGSKFVNVFNNGPLYTATKSWARGEMSNFHYLMLLNTMSGRTFNDLTQYPVFPWVLADYSSAELDLTDPRSFRDLSKPMGCQTPQREAEFRERYVTFAEMSDSPPFHYGTHYSSAMIVSSYLIRLQPFVQSYLLLQGGNFDHAERLFHSIENAWLSSSRTNMSDVRELTPEFYYLPDFLVNINGFDFGVKQETGEKIDNVTLPPWAKGDPNVFIAKHRQALESEYVSRNLHKWIDLVFGFKQQGEAAIEATNVFHYLSYRGARNLDEIEDPVERAATIGIIHNFGQTPHQICPRSHIQREESSFKSDSLESAAEYLTQPSTHLLEIRDKITNLHFAAKHDRVLASAPFRLYFPPSFDRYMEWGFTDGSVRFFSEDRKKILGLFEQVHQLQVTCAKFAGSKVLITAGTDCTVSAWNIFSTTKAVDLQPKGTLYGHLSPVTILQISEAFSTILSASSDGVILLWDLNRLKFVRELSYDGNSLQCARINNVTGQIALCGRHHVSIYSLNAKLLIKEKICGRGIKDDDPNDREDVAAITSCAFYEGVGNEWLSRDLFFTGRSDGKVDIWNITCGAASGQWHLEFVKCLKPVALPSRSRISSSSPLPDIATTSTPKTGKAKFSESPSSSPYSRTQQGPKQQNIPAITCILPTAHSVYTGDEDGRVYEWTLPNPKDIAKYRDLKR